MSANPRTPRRQRLIGRIHAAGPRPILELVLEIADPRLDLDAVLERYAGLDAGVCRLLGADVLPIDTVTIIEGAAP